MKSAIAALVGLILGTTTAAHAFELKFSSSTPNTEVNEALERGSLLVPLADDAEATGQDILAAAQAEYGRLVGTLYDQGYFAPVINIRLDGREAAEISPLARITRVGRVDIRVVTGPLFQFGQTNIGPLAPDTELPPSFTTGQRATTGAIRDAVDASVDAWRDVGFAKAAPGRQQITARHDANRLNVDIGVDTGPRLRFGELIITGNERVRTDRIRDIAGLPTGQVFDPAELNKATIRLRRTGAFNVAALSEAEAIGPSDTLPINLQIVEEKPRRFGFGADISTTEGLGLEAFWLHRNLFGGAERLRVEGEIDGIGGDSGGADFRLGARFTRPATFNEDTDFFALTEIERLDQESFSADRFRIEAGIRRFASDEREYTLALGLQHARTEDAFGEREFTVFTAPATAEFDYRDSELDARNGYYAFISLMPFLAIEGTDNGLRSFADVRFYRPLGERLTFAMRGQVGSVAGPALADTPTDFLFYSGGGGTVRGQEFQDLGITLDSGEEIGGRSFLGVQGELRLKTTDSLSLVGFYDAGYIGEEAFPNASDGEWHSGAGLGVRYDTGIGPIRFDVGIPVSGPGDNSGFEIYIGIGQAF